MPRVSKDQPKYIPSKNFEGMTVPEVIDVLRKRLRYWQRDRKSPEEKYFLPDGYMSDERQYEVAKLLVERLRKHREAPELAPAGTLSRSRIDLSDLSKRDLYRAGFVPSLIAVPETGQSQIATYRHPFSGMHIHKHPKNWMFHEDKYASLQMIMRKYKLEHPDSSRKDQLKFFFKEALPYSAGHIVHEGTPGYVNYINNTILGRKGFFDEGGTNVGRALAGGAAATALATGIGALATGKVRPVTAGGGVGGFLLGNVIGNYIGDKATEKNPKYGMPSVFNTSVRAGIPILSTVLGAYLGNKLEDKLGKKYDIYRIGKKAEDLEKDAASLRAPNKAIMNVKKRAFEMLFANRSPALNKGMRSMPGMGVDSESAAKNIAFIRKQLLKAIGNNNVKGAKRLRRVIQNTQIVYDLPSMHEARVPAGKRAVTIGKNVLSRRDFNPEYRGGSAWFNSGLWAQEGLSQKNVDNLSRIFGIDPNKPTVYFSSFRDRNGKAMFSPQVLLHELGHAYDESHGGIENFMRYFGRGVRRAKNPYGAVAKRGNIPIMDILKNEDLMLKLDPTLRQEYAASLAGGGRSGSPAFRANLDQYRLDRIFTNWGRNMGVDEMREMFRQARRLPRRVTNHTYDSLSKMRVGWGKGQDRVTEKLMGAYPSAT